MGFNKITNTQMNAIILFLKNYNKTKVKTRLAKDTSFQFAKNFYKNCIEDILITLNKCQFSYFLFWYPFPIKKEINNFAQIGNDLGERMYNALKKIFSFGYNNAIIIGSDIPHIDIFLINKSFEYLQQNYDYVFGPSEDGGFYLIGTKNKKLTEKIFKSVQWSTNSVLKKTIENLKNNNLSFAFLPILNDIDTLLDLKEFYKKNNKMNLKTIKFLKNNNAFLNYNTNL